MSFSVASSRRMFGLWLLVAWRWDRGALCVGRRIATSCPIQLRIVARFRALHRGAARSGERALIATRLGDLDVVQGLDGVLPYAELRSKAIDVEMAGLTIAICALEHLRAMKQAAGRPRDLVDLDDLDAAQPGGD